MMMMMIDEDDSGVLEMIVAIASWKDVGVFLLRDYCIVILYVSMTAKDGKGN